MQPRRLTQGTKKFKHGSQFVDGCQLSLRVQNVEKTDMFKENFIAPNPEISYMLFLGDDFARHFFGIHNPPTK
jgi:hypothetical protein